MTSLATDLPRRLPSIRPWLLHAGIILWAAVTAPIALYLALGDGRLVALPVLAFGPAAFLLRHRPMLAGAVILAGGFALRVAYIGWSETDPIELSRQASIAAFSGQNPYEGWFANGSPYAYGPLGLITYRAGILGELLGATGTSVVLLWARSWLTLAIFNAWPLFLYSSVSGNNDYSVGFLLILGLVVLRTRPRIGMVLLAAAGAVKPYVAAWALPAAIYAGLTATLIGLAAALLFWAPVIFVWGIPSALTALRQIDAGRSFQAQHFPSWTFADIPALRLLVIPFSLAAIWFRSWRAAVLLGAAGFLAFLGFSPWAHHGFLGAVVPVLGLGLEYSERNGVGYDAAARRVPSQISSSVEATRST